MEPSITRYGADKKKKRRKLFTGPCYLLPKQFYQPGDCEEKGWPDVTHIVASAFEGPGSPRGPEMGWLNRFSVLSAGPGSGVRFNLSNNEKVDRRSRSFPNKGWIFYQKSNWVASGSIFIHSASIRGILLGVIQVWGDLPDPLGVKRI